jgi:hypothetical protein
VQSVSEKPFLDLDCRYALASHLPLDTLLAMDDAMTELNGRQSSDPVELCTFLAHQWLFAYGRDDKELYVLLDSKRYVTVADVQSAVQVIREKYFNNE